MGVLRSGFTLSSITAKPPSTVLATASMVTPVPTMAKPFTKARRSGEGLDGLEFPDHLDNLEP